MTVKVAVVQAAPVLYNLDASLEKAIGIIANAAKQGCELVAFGEAWLSGYPFHIWLGPPAWGMQYVVPFFENALDLAGPQFAKLCAAASDNKIMVSMGYSERAGASLFLGQALISATGEVLQARRKLKPTHVERTVYGEGYGGDLGVVETPLGRMGQLCCWEHLQPLSKYAQYSQGEQIHIAAWPAFSVYRGAAFALGPEVNTAVAQVYAVEGQCFVLSPTSIVDAATLATLQQDQGGPPLLMAGGGAASIFAPDGQRMGNVIPETEEGLVIAELDFSAITIAKSVADPSGHYAKPEATQLVWHKTQRSAVIQVTPAADASTAMVDEEKNA